MKKVLLTMALCLVATVFAASAQKKVAFVNVAETVNDILDDDEAAAARWAINTYGAEYLPVSQITPQKLSEYDVLWIMVDDEYYAGLPDELLDATTLGYIKDYYKAGGNLLLNVFGNIMLKELGRIPFAPDIMGTGTGSNNPDIWYVVSAYGTWEAAPELIDRSSDPLFAGLTTEQTTKPNGNNYPIPPFLGAGWKEDHNCFWSMEIPDNVIANDNPDHLKVFESTYNVEALATWTHVADYFGAAIARWRPQGEFQGKAITVGAGSLEWNQNNTVNPYQSNIDRFFKNALDELTGVNTGVETIKDMGEVINTNYFSLQGGMLTKPLKGLPCVEKTTYKSGKSISKIIINK